MMSTYFLSLQFKLVLFIFFEFPSFALHHHSISGQSNYKEDVHKTKFSLIHHSNDLEANSRDERSLGEEQQCYNRNFCSKTSEFISTYNNLNCFCDEACTLFGDCCVDYSGPEYEDIELHRSMISCSRVKDIDMSVELYIIQFCPKFYDNETIKANCESDISLQNHEKNIFSSIPVVGIKTGLLYRNYFCALCSGDVEVRFWSMRIDCGEIPPLPSKTIGKLWIDSLISYTYNNRHFCSVKIDTHMNKARLCKSHISRCNRDFKNKKMKKKCKSHTQYVYVGKLVFRNKHCAFCNFVNESYLSCDDTRAPKTNLDVLSGVEPPFSVVLNINTGKISKYIGKSNKVSNMDENILQPQKITYCPEGQLYDPYQRACNSLYCYKNGTLTNENCPIYATETTTVFNTIKEYSTDLITKYHSTILSENQSSETSSIMNYLTNKNISYVSITLKPDIKSTTTVANSYEDYNDEQNDLSGLMESCTPLLYNTSDYIMFENKSLIYLGQIFHPSEYTSDNHFIYICTTSPSKSFTGLPPLIHSRDSFFQFDWIQSMFFFVGSLVSMLGLAILVFGYICMKPMRDVHGKCVVCLAVSILAIQLIVMISIERVEIYFLCLSIGAVLHYLMLVSFMWMNVIAYIIWKKSSNPLNISSGTIQRTDPYSGFFYEENAPNDFNFTCYFFFAVLTPLICIGFSLLLDLLDASIIPDIYKPDYGKDICWISNLYAMLLLFGLPAALITFISLGLFFISVFNLSQKKVIHIGKFKYQRHKPPVTKVKLFLYLLMLLIMTAVWSSFLAAVITKLSVVWYVFISSYTLQGIFLYLIGMCNKKVFRQLWRKGNRCNYTSAKVHDGNLYFSEGTARIVAQETSI